MILELHKKLNSKEVTSVELIEDVFKKIEKEDKELKCFLALYKEDAIKAARQSDERRKSGQEKSLIDGLPISIKDIIGIEGKETTAASNILRSYIPPFSATVVKKLEDAGAVIIGKNNLDAFAHGSSTENSDFFTTSNPHDKSRVPGGSSGGSAAAVAAGLGVFSIGTDTGGSIRQPASFCGVAGFKPSYGRVSRNGVIAMASSLDCIGPICKNAEDAKIVFDIIKGVDVFDSTTLERDGQLEAKETSSVRIGVIKGIEDKIKDEDTKNAYVSSIEVLKSLGCNVEEFDFSFLDLGLPVYYIVQTAEVSSNLSKYDGVRYGYSALRENHNISLNDVYTQSRTEGLGSEAKRRIMLGNFVLSSGYYDAYYKKAMQIRTMIIDGYMNIFSKCDFIMTPVSPSVAFEKGTKTTDPVEMYLEDLFTVVVNLAGLPAISIPAKKFKTNLPTAVQFIGQYLRDEELLDFCGKIEKQIL